MTLREGFQWLAVFAMLFWFAWGLVDLIGLLASQVGVQSGAFLAGMFVSMLFYSWVYYEVLSLAIKQLRGYE